MGPLPTVHADRASTCTVGTGLAARRAVPGVLGKWDSALYDRYRHAVAGSDEGRAMLGELARCNDRLVIHLLRQRCRREPSDVPAVPGWKVRGSERLPWEDAEAAAREAFVLAMGDFDPSKGKLSAWLNWKVIDELEKAVQLTGVVIRGRHRPVAGVVFLEDDDALAERLEEDDGREMRDPEPWAGATELRRAMAIFLEDHCHFAATARAAACSVRGRFESVVHAHGEWMPRGSMTAALAQYGVRATTIRVPWSESPVSGFRGVLLQNAGRGETQ